MDTCAGSEQMVPAHATVMMLGSPGRPQLIITAGTGYSILPGFQYSFDIFLSNPVPPASAPESTAFYVIQLRKVQDRFLLVLGFYIQMEGLGRQLDRSLSLAYQVVDSVSILVSMKKVMSDRCPHGPYP